MSFSSNIKDELCTLRIKSSEEKRALLFALTHTTAAISITRNGLAIEYTTENENVGILISALAAQEYQTEATLSRRVHERLNAVNTLVTLKGEKCIELLRESGCFPHESEDDFEMGHIPQAQIQTDDAIRHFIRGAFLGAGSMSNPNKGYHMEIVCRHEGFANELCALITNSGMNTKVSKRKSSYIVYIKEGECLGDFLSYIGSVRLRLEFEDVRMLREVKNDVNRKQNFDDANMQKTAVASAQQLRDITFIASEIGLDKLNDKLREMAEIRLNYPEASISELADILGIGKSGANHRLVKLSRIAQDLRLH